MAALEGKRGLVVEDEPAIALMMGEVLHDEGCAVVGPISRVIAAVETARATELDFAVLDVNIAGVHVFPVADALAEREVPFVFITAYDRSILPAAYADRPIVGKPFRMATLLAAIAALFE